MKSDCRSSVRVRPISTSGTNRRFLPILSGGRSVSDESTEKGALVFFAGLNRVHLTLETAALMQQPNCSDDSRVLDQLQLERQGSSN
jgi:hypothetical protein